MKQVAHHPEVYEISRSVHQLAPSVPPLPSVSRPHLVKRIEEGMAGRLVLVSAPAGWGKSSLVAEWARCTTSRIAWVNCESAAGDGTRLIRMIVSAIDRTCPGFGRDLFPMLRSARPIPAHHLLSMLESTLSEYEDNLVLVLDDFHLIDDPDFQQGMYALIGSSPPNVRFVVAGRASPPWPLARWRAYGLVTEIETRDLAFSPDEVIQLLGAECQDREVAEMLQRRSEGWVAGLRLAQLWMRQLDDLSQVKEWFRGSHRDIADYLAEEVLRHLPAATERFLMTTAVLDRFNAPLAAAVSDVADPARLLADLEQRGLFVIPLDHERQWYRYHAIFREFLQARLHRLMPDAEHELLSKTGEWFEANGQPVDAAHAYLGAGDVRRAAGVIDGVAERLLLRDGETVMLIRLVEQLPPNVLEQWPSLERFFAWALVLTGRLDEAETSARRFEERSAEAPPDRQRFLRAETASIRSRIAAYRGEHSRTIAFAEVALKCADETVDWFRADALLSLGFAYRATGEIDKACDAFGEASRLGGERIRPCGAVGIAVSGAHLCVTGTPAGRRDAYRAGYAAGVRRRYGARCCFCRVTCGARRTPLRAE